MAEQAKTSQIGLELEQRLAELAASESRYRSLLETMSEGLIETDATPKLTYVNPQFARMLGYAPDEMIRQSAHRFLNETARQGVSDRIAQRKAGRSEVYELGWLHHDGHDVPTRISSKPHFDAQSRYVGSTATVTDLTESQRTEAAGRRADRALHLHNVCNTIIIRANDEARLLIDTCRVLVDVGGYKLAWIGYAEHDEAKSVRPVARAGSDGEYVANATISWADTEPGRDPTGAAIHTGAMIIAHDTDIEPSHEPWRQMAHAKRYRSSAAIPLRGDGDVFGALMLYAAEAGAFDADEARLLTELTDELAFGIVALRSQRGRDRLAAIVDSAGKAIVGRDLSGTITSWNKAAERLFGYNAREIVGRPMGTLIPPEIADEAGWLLDKMRRSETLGQLDTVRMAKDGRRIGVSLTISPIRDATGEIEAVAVLMLDNTERRMAEAELRTASAYARSLLEASPDPLVTISVDGRITDVNKATESATGIGRDHLIGSDFCLYFTEPEKARDGYRQAFSEGYVTDYPLALRHVSGRVADVLYNASTYRDEHGDVVGVFAAARDITRRMQAEQTVRRQAEQYAAILTATTDGYWLVDADGKLLEVNDTYCRMSGYSRGELAAFDISRVEAAATPEVVAAYLQKAGTNGFDRFESRHRRKDGSLFDVEISIAFWQGANLFVLFARDITARKVSEAELAKYRLHLEELVSARTTDLVDVNQSLEVANKELESFAYSVSHDMRAPLRTIDGFSQILLEDYGDKLAAEGRRVARIVRDGARTMAQMIEDILAFSRIGRRDMAHGSVDMAELVQAALQDLAPEMAGRSIDVTKGPLPSVQGDRAMLRRVWMNLLHNAVKFTARSVKAAIEVGSRLEGPDIIYFVKDNGAGFDMQYVEKLFGVFQRLHSPSDFPGTGIGLAIVKRIVTRHGGHVWAQGKVNEGAAFYFAVPASGVGNG